MLKTRNIVGRISSSDVYLVIIKQKLLFFCYSKFRIKTVLTKKINLLPELHYKLPDLNDRKSHVKYQKSTSPKELIFVNSLDESHGRTYRLLTGKLTPFDCDVIRRLAGVMQ